MRGRVLARFEQTGGGVAAVRLLDSCVTAALAVRVRELPDADPRLLHPARTVLIMLDDAGVTDALLLAAGALLDSDEPRWHGSALGALLPADGELQAALKLCAMVPTPQRFGEERLLEELVSAPHELRLLACAERLDHARHVHLVNPAAALAWVEQVAQVYEPVAWRTEPRLARRLARWAEASRRKLATG